MKIKRLILKSKQDTINLAKTIAEQCKKGDIITLRGTLGAGKTFFTNAFINAIYEKDGKEAIEVTSPTFNIVKIYEAKDFPIYHYDLYRLKNSDELYELGIEESLEEGINLIEWPEIAEDIIGDDVIDIKIEHSRDGEERVAEVRNRII